MNKLAQVLLVSRNCLAVITSAVMMNFLAVEVTKAQPQPSCFMIDTFGEVINLAHICNVKSNVATTINYGSNNTSKSKRTTISYHPGEIVHSVGDASVPFTLGTSSALYYSGNSLVYVRRYREVPRRFNTRNNIRNAVLGLGTNNRRANFSGRVPFLIYRYQK